MPNKLFLAERSLASEAILLLTSFNCFNKFTQLTRDLVNSIIIYHVLYIYSLICIISLNCYLDLKLFFFLLIA